jgi:hypothetical protein
MHPLLGLDCLLFIPVTEWIPYGNLVFNHNYSVYAEFPLQLNFSETGFP